jgi:hypothetical protein
MKPDIQTNMENRINEIRNQNTIFDDTITTIESTLNIEMTESAATLYTGTDDAWSISVVLDESLDNGIITVGLNRTNEHGDARVASMTITSTRRVQESINNIDNIVNHRYIVDLFAAIFEAVKNTNSGSGDNS